MAKPPGRRAAIVSGLMAASAGAALASARRFYRASLPDHSGRTSLSGLRSPVEVVRDVHGVPHVRAATVEDAVAAQAFCHAQDRLWQIELVRRLARGRLAELLGPPGLGTDRLLRILGLARVADREAAALQGADRAFVESYCSGINAFLRSPRFRPPFELRLLKASTV
jgi:penicillin amidase